MNEKTKRCDSKKVTRGDYFSLYGFGRIIRVPGREIGGFFEVQNHTGFTYQVARDVLENEYAFADQHASEEKIARTKVIQVLRDSPRTAMTVVYTKKVDPKTVATELAEGQGDIKPRTWAAKVKKLLEGEQRTLIGHHVNSFDVHGRLRFTCKEGLRLIDPRTIKSLVVGQVRYEVKQ